jgi:hypothetical protein
MASSFELGYDICPTNFCRCSDINLNILEAQHHWLFFVLANVGNKCLKHLLSEATAGWGFKKNESPKIRVHTLKVPTGLFWSPDMVQPDFLAHSFSVSKILHQIYRWFPLSTCPAQLRTLNTISSHGEVGNGWHPFPHSNSEDTGCIFLHPFTKPQSHPLWKAMPLSNRHRECQSCSQNLHSCWLQQIPLAIAIGNTLDSLLKSLLLLALRVLLIMEPPLLLRAPPVCVAWIQIVHDDTRSFVA